MSTINDQILKPWRKVSADTPSGKTAVDVICNGETIAYFIGPNAKQNADRAVKSVNACRNISNENLEDDAVVKTREYCDHLLAENKELLAVLKRLAHAAFCRDTTMGDPIRLISVVSELSAAHEAAMEVIKKVNGGQA